MTENFEHTLLVGPPGVGKTLYARKLAEKPPFPLAESDSSRSYIYRVAGLHDRNDGVTPPFRAPHYTVSEAGMRGLFQKDYQWRPGELSLAHGGTLLLDELPEFRSSVLESVREAMAAGNLKFTTHRARILVPARFRLVCAMNPCPCGYLGSEARECRCKPEQINRYLARVPTWIHKLCKRVEADELKSLMPKYLRHTV